MPHPTPSPAPISAAEQAVIDHASAVLRDIIDTAAEMARIAHRQALAQAERMDAERMAGASGRRHPYIDFTLAFERASRCVRRGIMLRLKLHEPRPTGYDIALAAQHHAAQHHAARRDRAAPIIDASATDIEHTEIERPERPDRPEPLDRLDDDEFDDMDRPMGDIVGELCADLRIALPEGIAGWAHLTPNQLIAGPSRLRETVQQAVINITSSGLTRTADPPPYPLRP